MTLDRTARSRLRADPAVKAIIARWRRLTGGSRVPDPDRRTLLACSAGPDSSALVIALAATVAESRADAPPLVVASIRHQGMRSPAELAADLAAAADLASRCGLTFRSFTIDVSNSSGNREALARKRRYAALVDLARADHCPFIATGHHADDQTETILLRLFRGSGPRGLAGIRRSRELQGDTPGPIIRLIRPLLTIRRADAERICAAIGWAPRIDQTNFDTRLSRAAVRAGIRPVIDRHFPAAAENLARLADLMTAVDDIISSHAAELARRGHNDPASSTTTFDRSHLRAANPAVLGELLRRTALLARSSDRDRATWVTLSPIIAAITGPSTDPRTFTLAGATVRVTAHQVLIQRPMASA